MNEFLKPEVPLERLEHKTKPELALEMLDVFRLEGIPFNYVQADGLYEMIRTSLQLYTNEGFLSSVISPVTLKYTLTNPNR